MYTIKEAAAKVGLPASTIRYYDKQGLLPFVERSESGYRQFSESDIKLLNMIECLKCTGMPIKEIKLFCQWVQQGDDSLLERYQMFQERRQAVLTQMEQLENALKVIEYKCWYYKTAVEAGTEAVHKKKSEEECDSKAVAMGALGSGQMEDVSL